MMIESLNAENALHIVNFEEHARRNDAFRHCDIMLATFLLNANHNAVLKKKNL